MKTVWKEKIERNKSFFIGMILFAIVSFAYYFEGEINAQGTTVFAFSYKHGFISRGFMGSMLAFLDTLTPKNLMTYQTIYRLSFLASIAFFILLFILYFVCIIKVDEKHEEKMKYLIVAVSILAFPEFLTYENFGRLDVYLSLIMLLCILLLLTEKWEWMIVPLSVLGTVIHQGYVFMYINIILVLLLYKAWRYRETKGKAKKYIAIFLLSFLSVSVFFLYFEFFSHSEGQNIYNEVVSLARSLSMDGKSVNNSLLRHEILGEDVFELEWKFHVINYKELPLFLLCFSPIIVIMVHFFKGMMSRSANQKEKLMYAVILLGAITVLPEMILKIDYGRYVYAILFYYIMITVVLLAMKDTVVEQQLEQTKNQVQKKVPVGGLFYLYLMMMVPFLDVRINYLTLGIMNLISKIG